MKDSLTLKFLTDLFTDKEEKQVINDVFEELSNQKIIERYLKIEPEEEKR